MKDIIAHLKLRIGEATDWGNKPDCDKVLITTSEASAIVEALEGKVWILDYSKISNIQFDGIDHKDAPDYCDAYISSADYDGEDMTEWQLEEINNDHDFVYEQLMDYLH